jgi:acetoin utilization deacetylase AcuC-like enzyme
MRNTGLVVDPRFREHDPGAHHPERPERLKVLEELFAGAPYASLPRIAPRPALEEEIARVHDRAQIRSVAASAGKPVTHFDADTSASAKSFDAALLAAGAAIEMADAILDGSLNNGFAALRPPGHHAERDRAMGFCFFNNVAVVARHLRDKRRLGRVLVLDWDVHHGNGTQHTFWGDASVMYVSLHQFPFYPGTGNANEIGYGEGAGYTVNLPMRAGWGPEEYLAAFRDVVVPIARRFAPEFVLVSAGFDAHHADPLASMELDPAAFAAMTDAVSAIADESADGRVLLLLEGGYSLEALRDSVAAVVERLRDPRDPAALGDGGGELTSWGEASRTALRAYWDI